MRTTGSLYDEDFYAWSNQQAALLRAGKLSEADIENIAEEIESMGKTEKRELVNRLTVLLQHLLKWQFQPGRRGSSWQGSIDIQRLAIQDHLADNPSLKALVDDAVARAYRYATKEAALETRLPEKAFPANCPWTFMQVVSEDFWPD